MAFISGEYSFYVLRFLLGAAEAGFFPGVLFFFTLWFPAAFRARAVAFLLFSAPVALSFGGPISGAILGLDGVFEIAGWRWMFFLEALPAVIMCFVVLRYLPDRPADAEWLAPNERDWLEGQIASEEKEQAVSEKGSLLSALANPSVLLLGYVNFTSILVTYGVSFFLPRIIKDFGLTDLKTGFVSSVPYALCAVALVWWGRRSDRKRERRFHTALPLLVAGVGLAAAALVTDPTAKVAGFSLAVIGSFSFSPPFWAFSFSNMSSKDAPASIAAINAIGNLGGFFGPWIMGFFRDYTGGYAAGLLILGTGAVVSAAIVLTMGRRAGKGISIERQSTTI